MSLLASCVGDFSYIAFVSCHTCWSRLGSDATSGVTHVPNSASHTLPGALTCTSTESVFGFFLPAPSEVNRNRLFPPW